MENKTYNNIITSIVVAAASSVAGVAAVTYEPGLIVPTQKKKNQSAVETIIKDDYVTVNLSINVYYGKVIPVVVCNLQEKIKKEIESSTSLKVKKINVTVVGSVNP
jgi:uncharacterized alkaline shock family protein YloU